MPSTHGMNPHLRVSRRTRKASFCGAWSLILLSPVLSREKMERFLLADDHGALSSIKTRQARTCEELECVRLCACVCACVCVCARVPVHAHICGLRWPKTQTSEDNNIKPKGKRKGEKETQKPLPSWGRTPLGSWPISPLRFHS